MFAQVNHSLRILVLQDSSCLHRENCKVPKWYCYGNNSSSSQCDFAAVITFTFEASENKDLQICLKPSSING